MTEHTYHGFTIQKIRRHYYIRRDGKWAFCNPFKGEPDIVQKAHFLRLKNAKRWIDGGCPSLYDNGMPTVWATARREAGAKALGKDADTKYKAALALVGRVDADLRGGTRHYRDTSGRLLMSLDEVVNAALNGGLGG